MNVWPFGLRMPALAPVAPPQSRFGSAALAVLFDELGNGETVGDNVGPDLDRYRTDLQGRLGPPGAWCAAIVSYGLEHGAHNLRERCPVKRSHSAKTLFERCLVVGSRVALPLPGDIACWHRGAAGARTGHIAIVARGLLEGEWLSIDGNRGTYPSKVRRYPHELGEALFLGFARLP